VDFVIPFKLTSKMRFELCLGVYRGRAPIRVSNSRSKPLSPGGEGKLLTNKSVVLEVALMMACLLVLFLVAGCSKPPAERGHKRIMVLGDSLTAGEEIGSALAYPAVLEGMIRQKGYPGVTVTGDGVSGATTETGLVRLKKHLESPPGGGEPEKVDILVLALGANDGLRRLDLQGVQGRLSEMIGYAQSRGMTVILAGMRIPPHNGLDYMSSFEKMYVRLAREHRVRRIPFLLKGVAAKPSLNLDGIHPNAEGHKILARNVLKVLEPLL
jgi:acyl-CoA thioesterase I